jgi:hypothetical protein
MFHPQFTGAGRATCAAQIPHFWFGLPCGGKKALVYLAL